MFVVNLPEHVTVSYQALVLVLTEFYFGALGNVSPSTRSKSLSLQSRVACRHRRLVKLSFIPRKVGH